jgi:hypothetical protein
MKPKKIAKLRRKIAKRLAKESEKLRRDMNRLGPVVL